MEIPNLSSNQAPSQSQKSSLVPVILIIVVIAVTTGFWLSRYFPGTSYSDNSSAAKTDKNNIVSSENIKDKEDVKVGVVFGNLEKEFKDKATGTIALGNINGEGTHILEREGGASQRVALTSSAVDLDLFVGYKVEVNGQTNTSTKASWLLDVGTIKRLE